MDVFQRLYVAIIDFSEAFGLVYRDGLFKLIDRIDCMSTHTSDDGQNRLHVHPHF